MCLRSPAAVADPSSFDYHRPEDAMDGQTSIEVHPFIQVDVKEEPLDVLPLTREDGYRLRRRTRHGRHDIDSSEGVLSRLSSGSADQAEKTCTTARTLTVSFPRHHGNDDRLEEVHPFLRVEIKELATSISSSGESDDDSGRIPVGSRKNLTQCCDECGMLFSCPSDLDRHKRGHAGEKPFECMLCAKTFGRKDHLRRHLRSHTGERPFSCDACDKSFSQKTHLIKHSQTHMVPRPMLCSFCGDTFVSEVFLRKHMRSHTGEPAYKCDECNRGFTKRSNLNRHLLVHSGEKPVVCEECGKEFSQRAHLQTHYRTHTGERPFQCQHCGRRFCDSSTMQRHIKLKHFSLLESEETLVCAQKDGLERPPQCEHCGRYFHDRSSLRRHTKRVHEVSIQL